VKDTKVEIVWTDSGLHYENGWESRENIIENCSGIATVSTVGWLFHDDASAYFVATSRDPAHGHYFGVQVIKKTNVISNRRLRR